MEMPVSPTPMPEEEKLVNNVDDPVQLLELADEVEYRQWWRENVAHLMHFEIPGASVIKVSVESSCFAHACFESKAKSKDTFSLVRASRMNRIEAMVNAFPDTSLFEFHVGYDKNRHENTRTRMVILDRRDRYVVVLGFRSGGNGIKGRLITTYVADTDRAFKKISESPKWQYGKCLSELHIKIK